MDMVNVRRGPDGQLYTVPVDPASQQRFEDQMRRQAEAPDQITTIQGQVAKAAAITLALGEIRAVIPGVGGLAFGALLSGTGVSSGHVPVFGPALFGNFLPAPIGYVGESATGVPHNYYLPAGSSKFLPEFIDPLEKGFGLQRGEDAARAAAQSANDLQQRITRADALARQLPTGVLADLAAGVPLGRGNGVVQQLDTFSFTEQRAAAARVLAARPPEPVVPPVPVPTTRADLAGAVNDLTAAVAGLSAEHGLVTLDLVEAAALLDEGQAQINAQLRATGPAFGGPLDPFGAPVANGSLLPENIQPVNDAAKRNQDGATGIRRVLVSERADP